VSSNPIHDEMYLIQHYVIKFVSDLWHGVVISGYSNKTDCLNITEILLKVTLNTINQTKSNPMTLGICCSYTLGICCSYTLSICFCSIKTIQKYSIDDPSGGVWFSFQLKIRNGCYGQLCFFGSLKLFSFQKWWKGYNYLVRNFLV